METVIIPDHPIVLGIPRKPMRDAVASICDWLATKAHRRVVGFSWAVGYTLCGKTILAKAKRYLTDAGVLKLYATAVPKHLVAEFQVSFPQCAWKIHRLETVAGRKRRTTRCEARICDLTASAREQVVNLMFGVGTQQEAAQSLTEPITGEESYWLLAAISGSWCASQDRWGRLYTPWTQMKREYRGYWRFDGEPVGKVDVVSCTPLIAAAIARNAGWRDERFLEDCESGGLYSVLEYDTGFSREAVKNQTLRYLNNLTPREHDGFVQVFEAKYPVFAEWLRGHKAGGQGAYTLVIPAESKIMLDAAASLVREGITVATIHDAVLAPASQMQAVEEAVGLLMRRNLDLNPTFTQEVCAFDR